MNSDMRKDLRGALAYCWVLGWYAGTDGKTTDEGKIAASKEQFERLLEKWDLKVTEVTE